MSRHFTVVLYDKHGCGQSDRNRREFTLETELRDLETVINHYNLDEITLLGMSCAGPVAVEYTYQNPGRVSYLILYSSWLNGKDIVNSDMRSGIAQVVRASWGVGSKMLIDLLVPGADPQIFKSLVKMQRASCTPEVAADLLLLGYSLDISHRVPHITTPALVIHREKDKTVPLGHGRTLAMEIPDAVFKVFKGNIHLPWMGDSTEISNEIIAFVHGEAALPKTAASAPQIAAEQNATIVFTDIVSSTRILDTHGDKAARQIFIRHDKLIRENINQAGGKELQNLGDGFMLSFETASAALRCAASIQESVSALLPSVSVRIGINTGEVVIREGDHPFGQAVVKAARIVNQCRGGQILLSEVTRQLCAGSNFKLKPRGQFTPKGFDEPITVHELLWKTIG